MQLVYYVKSVAGDEFYVESDFPLVPDSQQDDPDVKMTSQARDSGHASTTSEH